MKNVTIGKHIIPLWLIIVLLISGIGVGVLADYVWKTLIISVEVKDPLKILNYPFELSLFPGETKNISIIIQNHASLNYSVILDFHLNDTSYQTQYVTFSNAIYTIFSGQQNITAQLNVKPTAPSTNTSLTVNVRRIGEVIFFDDFDSGALRNEWNIIDLYGGSIFSLASMPGYLTISTTYPPNRDLWQGVNFYSPRVMQTTYGNFTIETKLWAVLNESVQSGGIVIWKNEENFLRLERAQRYGYQEILFIGNINGIFSMSSPEVSDPGAILHIQNVNSTYLRLIRKGSTYSGYYSSDSLNWHFIANITMETDYSLSVGIYNVVRGDPPVYSATSFTINFDYFKVSVEK